MEFNPLRCTDYIKNKGEIKMPKTTFKSSVELKEGMRCQASARNFLVSMDEPPSLGGTDRAMNPVELLLSSLGGCLVISAQAFAGECGVELKDINIELEGDLNTDGFLGKDPNVPAGLLDIRAKVNINTDSPSENVNKLIETIEKRCPVSDSLRRNVPVNVSFQQS